MVQLRFLQVLCLFDNRLIRWFFVLFLSFTVAAAAKSLQLCLTLCDPIDGSPPGSPVPEILQARTLEWVAISFSNAGKWKVKVKLLSRVRLLATPWTAAYEAPPSMGFSRQEYWSGLPLPAPFWVLRVLYILWLLILYQICDFQTFSPILWFAFLLCWWCLLIYRIWQFSWSPVCLLFLLLLVPLLSYPRNHCQTYCCATFALNFLLRVL